MFNNKVILVILSRFSHLVVSRFSFVGISTLDLSKKMNYIFCIKYLIILKWLMIDTKFTI